MCEPVTISVPMPETDDNEIRVMGALAFIMSNGSFRTELDDNARARVARWFNDKYGDSND